MKKQFRHKNGKAKKWIETIHAKKYLADQLFRHQSLKIAAANAFVRVNMIACAPTNSKIDEVRKAVALAQAIIDGMASINKAALEVSNVQANPPPAVGRSG